MSFFTFSTAFRVGTTNAVRWTGYTCDAVGMKIISSLTFITFLSSRTAFTVGRASITVSILMEIISNITLLATSVCNTHSTVARTSDTSVIRGSDVVVLLTLSTACCLGSSSYMLLTSLTVRNVVITYSTDLVVVSV